MSETVAAPTADAGLSLAVVELPRGSFRMGATEDDKFGNMLERPPHMVAIDYPVALGTYPVTVAQWYAVADPAIDVCSEEAALPMAGVSWDDAVDWCAALSARTGGRYRLPTEAEWEYACRAGTTSVFHTGDTLTPDHANFLYDELGHIVGRGRRTPVGRYAPNAWGFCDMLGNIAELTADAWHDTYDGAPTDGSARSDPPDPAHKDHGFRVVRGGAWDHLPRLLRCAHRDWLHRSRRLDNVGFRVALDLRSAR